MNKFEWIMYLQLYYTSTHGDLKNLAEHYRGSYRQRKDEDTLKFVVRCAGFEYEYAPPERRTWWAEVVQYRQNVDPFQYYTVRKVVRDGKNSVNSFDLDVELDDGMPILNYGVYDMTGDWLEDFETLEEAKLYVHILKERKYIALLVTTSGEHVSDTKVLLDTDNHDEALAIAQRICDEWGATEISYLKPIPLSDFKVLRRYMGVYGKDYMKEELNNEKSTDRAEPD